MNFKHNFRLKNSGNAVPLSTRLAYILAPAAVFTAPFLNFIVFQEYNLTDPEVLIAGGIVLVAGVLLGAVMALRPPTLGQILLVACILVSLDMGFPHFRLQSLALPNITPWSVLIWHWAVVIGLLVGARLLYRHFATIVLIVFAVISVTTVLIPTAPQTQGVTFERAVEAKTSQGPIIHLILDEFLGIEGIPTDIAGGSELREDLKRFFLENEFLLHGGAFSHSSETQQAVAALLNGQFLPSAQTAFEDVHGPTSWHLRRNAWFELLASEGYAIQIYDNSWIGYCEKENTQIELCYLSLANSIKPLEGLAVPVSDKAKVILSAYLELSFMSVFLREIANLPIYRLGPLATPEVLDLLAKSVATDGSGRLIFGHLMSPHYGYVYQANCKLKKNIATWKNRTLPFHCDGTPINTPESRIERYKAYFAQVRCMQHQLQAFFDKLHAAGRYDEATIIIHGDHGSRISIWNPKAALSDRLSDRDIIDNYSTLYAVKQPGVRPAYESRVRSIQAIFAEQFLERPLHPDPREIILRGSGRLNPNLSDGNRLRPYPNTGP